MLKILGVRVDSIKKSELAGKLRGFLAEAGYHKVFTPNAEMLLAAHQDRSFKECLNTGELNLADGVGVVSIGRMMIRLNTNCVHQILDRITGVDTLELLCKIAAEDGRKVFFLGADPGVGEKAAEVMKNRYKGLIIKANDGGVITKTKDEWSIDGSVLNDLSDFAPDILAVALGHGKQEQLLCSMLEHWPSVKIGIGVGGALDYLSGNVRRAPIWMRRMGFEWLYRLIQQPKRIHRIFNAVIVFPFVVIWSKITSL